MKSHEESEEAKQRQRTGFLTEGLNVPLDGVTGSVPPLTGVLPVSGSPLTDGVSGGCSWSRSGGGGGGGGVELVLGFVLVRSGVLAAGDGELWGSGVGVRSDQGEPDLRLPGTGDGFCWGSRSRSFSCS